MEGKEGQEKERRDGKRKTLRGKRREGRTRKKE